MTRDMISAETSVRVRYADTDQMGVAYHSNYLVWFEVGRTELMRDLGLPYTEMEARGISLPVIEAWCHYVRAAKYDDCLTIISAMNEMPRARVKLSYRVLKEDSILLAEGYTVHGFLSESGKPVRPPKYFLDKLKDSFR